MVLSNPAQMKEGYLMVTDEMLKKVLGDMDTCKEEILGAMDRLVSEKDIRVRPMLFSSLVVILHAIHHMHEGDKEEVDGYVKYAFRMVEMLEESYDEMQEANGTTH